MAWTDPKDWSVGEVVTATALNTHVRDNFLAIPHFLDVANTEIDVVNTIAATHYYAATIPGNSLGPNGSTQTDIIGDVLVNDTGTSGLLTLRVFLGGSQILSVLGEYSDTATRRTFHSTLYIVNRGSTSSQVVRWDPGMPSPSVANFDPVQAAVTFDTTTNQTLEMTAQWSAASANNSFRRLWARTLKSRN